MRLFQNDINRPLCAVADQSLEIGRELLVTREAGTRLKLIAHLDELNYMKEAYTNLVNFIQVNSMANKLGAVTGYGNGGQPDRFQMHGIWTARSNLEAAVIVANQRFLLYLRDIHNLSVASLLDELSTFRNSKRDLCLNPKGQRKNKFGNRNMQKVRIYKKKF